MNKNTPSSFLVNKHKNLVMIDNKPGVFYHGTNRTFDSHDLANNRTILNNRFQGDWICYSNDINVAWKYTDAARNQCFDKTTFLEESSIIFKNDTKNSFPKYMNLLINSVINKGYSEGWKDIEEQYTNDMSHIKSDFIWRNFFTDLDKFSKLNNDFDINDFLDILDYVEYSKSGEEEEQINIFSTSIDEIPKYHIDLLKSLGYVKSIPEPKVIISHIYASSILKTSNREKAKNARNNGYDLVIYNGEGTVSNEPEYLIAHPSQVEIQSVVLKSSKDQSLKNKKKNKFNL